MDKFDKSVAASKAPAQTQTPRASGPTKRKVNRRKFLTDMAKTACGVSLFGLMTGVNSKQSCVLCPLTPFGPLVPCMKHDFLAACTRCGMCVQDCPYDI